MSAGGKGTETDIQWDIGDCTFFCFIGKTACGALLN